MAFIIVIPGSAPANTPITKPVVIMVKLNGSKTLPRPVRNSSKPPMT